MLRGAGSVSLAFLCLLCAASSAGSGISGEGSGDAHTYHADGRVVRNKVAHTHDDLALTSDRLSAAAFMMLADGLNGEAARTFAASARVTRNASPGCPAAFAAPSGVWVASHGGHYRPVCRRPRRAGNFFDGVSSMGEAVERYTKFHSEEMARGRIKADGRYVMYRPSFHGEGWGNRMMALVAVTALGMGTGRVVLVDWTSDWALQDFVEVPWNWIHWDREAAEKLPTAAITDPAQLHFPGVTPLDLAFQTPLVIYSSYSAFWGALLRHPSYRGLRGLCSIAERGVGETDDGEAAFRLLGCVAHATLSPSAGMADAVRDEWDPKLAGKHLVSAHIRLGPRHTSNYVMLDQRGVATAFSCLDRLLKDDKDWVLFLATDSPEVRVAARKRWGNRVLAQDAPIAHTGEQHALRGVPAVDQEGKTRGALAVRGAMLDWWLLGEAEHFLVSDKSSFGYSAVARAVFNSSVLPMTVSNRGDGCARRVWEGHRCGASAC